MRHSKYKKLLLVIFGAFLLLGAGLFILGRQQQTATIEDVTELPALFDEAPQATTTTMDAAESVATSSPTKMVAPIDTVAEFVCDKGIPDPSPDIESPITREIVVKAIEARYKLFLHAPIDCIRTYFLSVAESEIEASQLKSLSDEQLLELARGMAVFFDQPDRERMFKPTTIWNINGRELMITEMTDGSSSGHWNARYVNQMWW